MVYASGLTKGHGVLKLRCHGDVGDSLATDVPSSAMPQLLFPPLATFAPVQPVVTLRRIPGSHGVSKRQSDEMMR